MRTAMGCCPVAEAVCLLRPYPKLEVLRVRPPDVFNVVQEAQ